MSGLDPADTFDRALARLHDLRDSFARQVEADSVADAVRELQLSVVRNYGSLRSRSGAGHSARHQILGYLRDHVGEWVRGEELAVISGIGEWARRVRELRVEQGYRIEESAGNYRLLEVTPDVDAAERWRRVHEIRRGSGTAAERVVTLLTALVGRVATSEELAYVAGDGDVETVVTALRDVECRPIDSAMDAPDLSDGGYRLVTTDPSKFRDAGQVMFPSVVRAAVFRRDNFTCWRCRRDRLAAVEAGDDAFYLLMRHLDADAGGLGGLSTAALVDPARLATLCRSCFVAELAATRRAARTRDRG